MDGKTMYDYWEVAETEEDIKFMRDFCKRFGFTYKEGKVKDYLSYVYEINKTTPCDKRIDQRLREYEHGKVRRNSNS
jgi:hypothetical protein